MLDSQKSFAVIIFLDDSPFGILLLLGAGYGGFRIIYEWGHSGRVSGLSFRIPTLDVSVVGLTFRSMRDSSMPGNLGLR